MKKRPGYIVINLKGINGRTYHDQKRINGKIAVYFEQHHEMFDYDTKGILCDPDNLKLVGFID